jgi:hypothetical protein
MINYLIGCVLLITPIFIYFDGYKKSSEVTLFCKNKYKKFRKINTLVSTNYNGFFRILFISLCMILKLMWIYIIQYCNSTVTLTKDNKYIITYVIKGKTHKMVVTCNRGPSKVLLVYDENQKDVSNVVFPYLGPEENFHSCLYTPKFWNKKELIFELSNGSEKIFTENEHIIF